MRFIALLMVLIPAVLAAAAVYYVYLAVICMCAPPNPFTWQQALIGYVSITVIALVFAWRND
jgi:hypothetical protein